MEGAVSKERAPSGVGWDGPNVRGLWLSDLHEDCDPVAMVSYPDSKESDQWSIAIPYIRRYMQEAYIELQVLPSNGYTDSQ